jgi:hypothetical protein
MKQEEWADHMAKIEDEAGGMQSAGGAKRKIETINIIR